MTTPILDIRNISKQYTIGTTKERYLSLRDVVASYWNNLTSRKKATKIWALEDINLKVYPGETIGIIGRNGAGKSTFLKIISKITPPTKGIITARGRVASLLEVGTGFHPELTGRENIFLNGAILGLRRVEIKQKMEEIVDFSGVEQFIDTPLKHFSSGMQLRLAFAVAAHLEPEILLIDEVLAVGDVQFQKKCLGKMNEVSKSGRTILFVSHDMAAILNLCQRSILLDQGKIIADGPSETIVHHYLNQLDQNAHIKIAQRKDRKGNGLLKFSDIILQNKQGLILQNIICGQEIQVVLLLKNYSSQHIKNIRIDIGLDNYRNDRIAWLSTEMVPTATIDVAPQEEKSVYFKIPSFPFIPGNYSLTLYAETNGVVVDWIDNAFYFSVEAGNFYPSGKLPPKNQGMFLLNYSINT